MARNQIEVTVPPSVVFAVLADPARYRDWVVGAKEIRSFDHDWPAPGASFRHRFGLGPAAVSDVTTVLAADPPAELVLVACFGPVGAAEVRLRVDPSAAGSLVTMEERPVSGPLGAVRGARLLDLAIQVRNAASLRRLRRLAQGQGNPRRHGTPEPASQDVSGRAAKTRSRPSRPSQRAQAADPGVHPG